MEQATQQVKGSDQKYCTDCGKLILLKAEICPGCGCRQIAAPTISTPISFSNPFKVDSLAGPMCILLVLNFLWNGLGNIAIGDKRGWGWGFLNWLVLLATVFMLGIPSIIFFVYCGAAGYSFLVDQSLRKSEINLQGGAGQRTV